MPSAGWTPKLVFRNALWDFVLRVGATGRRAH